MIKTIIDVLKPTEKTYMIDGVEYIGITDFIKNRLSIKCRNKTILNETLDNYTNIDGLNMKGYINKCVKDYSKKVKQYKKAINEEDWHTIEKIQKEQLKA